MRRMGRRLGLFAIPKHPGFCNHSCMGHQTLAASCTRVVYRPHSNAGSVHQTALGGVLVVAAAGKMGLYRARIVC